MINLLPEEMRKKEEKERTKIKKRKPEGFKFVKPEEKKTEKVKEPEKIKEPSHKVVQPTKEHLPPQEQIKKKRPSFASVKYLWQPFKKLKKIFSLSTRKKETPEIPKEKKRQKEEHITESQPSVQKGVEVPEVSLMPQKAVVIPRLVRERILIFIAGLMVIIFLILVLHLYITWRFETLVNQARMIRSDLATTEGQIKSLIPRRNELARICKKASRVDNLLENHIYWTKLFYLLEKYTLPGVSWSDFSADTSGKLHLDGSAKDLNTVARQIVVLSQASDFVKKFSVSGITVGETANFGVDLELADGVFKK